MTEEKIAELMLRGSEQFLSNAIRAHLIKAEEHLANARSLDLTNFNLCVQKAIDSLDDAGDLHKQWDVVRKKLPKLEKERVKRFYQELKRKPPSQSPRPSAALSP